MIASLTGKTEEDIRALRKKSGIVPSFKIVDTCAAEFDAKTNYFYSTYLGESDGDISRKEKKRALIIGSGPIRIGQGVEFDYSAVHGVLTLQKLGYETIMINNNPETVSTDYEIADRLYFEPLTTEHILNVAEHENIDFAIVQFGGQTAINAAEPLEKAGIPLLGTSFETLDALEDRDLFYQLLDDLDLKHAKGETAYSKEEATEKASRIGYPVLIRPSYVIGGMGMIIVDSEAQMSELLENEAGMPYPILIDQYITGKELEIDLISDGHEVFVPTYTEHIERAGVHSGDRTYQCQIFLRCHLLCCLLCTGYMTRYVQDTARTLPLPASQTAKKARGCLHRHVSIGQADRRKREKRRPSYSGEAYTVLFCHVR